MIMIILNIFLYIVLAGIIAWVFKMATALISALVALIIGLIFRLKLDKINELFLKHPKIFLAYGVISNAIIGFVYSYVILYSTGLFYSYTHAKPWWLFLVFSVIWGATVIYGAENFHGILFFTTVLSILSIYLLNAVVFGPPLVLLVVIVIGMAYYYGRVDMFIENQDYHDGFN